MSKKTADDFVEIDKSNYKEYVFVKSPKSSHWKNMMWAFLIGGAICVLGQCFIELYVWLGIVREEASVLASATLVALAAIFTGIGIYDKMGRFAGAGSTIPITGFSNAVVAPALEFRCEGMIYGARRENVSRCRTCRGQRRRRFDSDCVDNSYRGRVLKWAQT